MDKDYLDGLRAMADSNAGKIVQSINPDALIRQAVKDTDLVWGLWNDPAAEHGVGVGLIKGRRVLQRIANGNRAEGVKELAFWCETPGACTYASRLLGDGRFRRAA
ncbi:hypothetical protein AAII07_55270 [Microvirga sp. 0TCS3.31]